MPLVCRLRSSESGLRNPSLGDKPHVHSDYGQQRTEGQRGQGEPDTRSVSIEDLATNGGQVAALDTETIDRLCTDQYDNFLIRQH